MFIKRDLEGVIKAGALQVPVIAIIGPRQSGKSTLAREIFKNHLYIDMQDAQMIEFANRDPKGFLNTYKNEYGIIIDEAQYAPALFGQIKVEADKNPQPGYYVLSGSQNFLLHEKISESLAGRVYIYTLLPLSIKELTQAELLLPRADQQMLKGFYPRVYQAEVEARNYYENYISTYVERDIRTIKNIDNILIFKNFMRLCALRIGSTLNYTDLAVSCGISITTVKSWLALLEASYILFLLPPYYNNMGKRIVKSPKLYFYDVGLAAALMGFDKEMVVKHRDVYGGLFENMAIVDLIKEYHARNKRPMLSFFRDSNQNEIDLMIELGDKLTCIEIKSSETINSNFFDTLDWFKQQTKEEQSSVLVYGGDQIQKRSQGLVVPWNKIDHIVT